MGGPSRQEGQHVKGMERRDHLGKWEQLGNRRNGGCVGGWGTDEARGLSKGLMKQSSGCQAVNPEEHKEACRDRELCFHLSGQGTAALSLSPAHQGYSVPQLQSCKGLLETILLCK